MIFQKKGELELCKWDIFSGYKNLIAYFSTRKAGFSAGAYDSLNLGVSAGDLKENVINNRKKFFHTINIPENETVWVKQVHGNNIITAERAGNLGVGDGLITGVSGLFLCGTFADCASIMVFEPKKQIVGLFHAGWKGVFQQIAKKGIKKICRVYNIQPDNLLVGISPHIKKCCFIVKKNVAELFNERFLRTNNKEHWNLDIENAVIEQLINVDIKRENIEKSCFCTSCNKEMFFSYRRDKGKTGRMLAVIGTRK